MKSTLNLAIILLLSFQTSPTCGHRVHLHSHQKSRGIFDRYVSKLRREEQEEENARELIRKQEEEEKKFEKRRKQYEKNFQKAEQEAQFMIQSVAAEDHVASPVEVQDMFGVAESEKEKQEVEKQKEEEEKNKEEKESEDEGFLGKFLAKRQSKQVQEQQQPPKRRHIFQESQDIMNMNQEMKSNDFAPGLATQAMYDALSQKQLQEQSVERQAPKKQARSSSVDQDRMKRLKDKLSAKLTEVSKKAAEVTEKSDDESEKTEEPKKAEEEPKRTSQSLVVPELDDSIENIKQANAYPQPIDYDKSMNDELQLEDPLKDDSIVPADDDSTLKKFNQLPVKTISNETQKQMQEQQGDAVSTFLQKVDEQEKNEQKQSDDEEKKKRELDAAMAFGHESHVDDQTYTNTTENDSDDDQQPKVILNREPIDIPEDNPISALMALKHPEQQVEIENAKTEEMAQSYYSNYRTTY